MSDSITSVSEKKKKGICKHHGHFQVLKEMPEKKHFVELDINNNGYRILASEPALPRQQELEDFLNSSNNYLQFFCFVREDFKRAKNSY